MKTLNEKVAETVKSNNATMGNVEELTKVLKQEEKELERLTKRNADEAVIAAPVSYTHLTLPTKLEV